MAKKKTYFLCSNCGHKEPKWLGRCPDCGEWNSFSETSPEAARATPAGRDIKVTPVQSIDQVEMSPHIRTPSGIGEVDRVLGGGIMKGSAILIGGEPGIGKSTLMLQLSGKAAEKEAVFYVSGEESPGQIKMRAERLGVSGPDLNILADFDLTHIVTELELLKPDLVIIDSIQTLFAGEAGSVPGTVGQLRFCCHELISWAKENNSAIFLIAHVTKEGTIAGPKVIEHMVDTVLYFDQSDSELRILRSTKNRFGSIDEIGLFLMDSKGLNEVMNPSGIFLEKRKDDVPAGISIASIYEGSRILMVEIQALTVPAKGNASRVYSDRIDSQRVSRVAAVLEKHGGIRFSDQDIYINIAGGLKISEVGIELPLALAIYSARTGLSLPPRLASSGELSLSGEIRSVSHLKRREKAASEMGYSQFYAPAPGKEPEKIKKVLNNIFHSN
ncbi:MAG: DNA repair protein RadA [Spirochaetaceae bacterium]|nr:DNA repair protein RadA [Spirochaetaceae bacterium]